MRREMLSGGIDGYEGVMLCRTLVAPFLIPLYSSAGANSDRPENNYNFESLLKRRRDFFSIILKETD